MLIIYQLMAVQIAIGLKRMDILTRVSKLLSKELEDGLFDPEQWKAFSKRATIAINGLKDWLIQRTKLVMS